jgi:hypothetical protein
LNKTNYTNIIDYGSLTETAQLPVIFKNKFQKPVATEILQSPIKAAEIKRPAALLQQVITSTVKNNYQTRLKTQVNPTSPVNVIESQNSPQLPRVVTLAARSASPLRVLARACNLSPRNLYHDDFLDMGSANKATLIGNNH